MLVGSERVGRCGVSWQGLVPGVAIVGSSRRNFDIFHQSCSQSQGSEGKMGPFLRGNFGPRQRNQEHFGSSQTDAGLEGGHTSKHREAASAPGLESSESEHQCHHFACLTPSTSAQSHDLLRHLRECCRITCGLDMAAGHRRRCSSCETHSAEIASASGRADGPGAGP
jgi:hypothetical protein